MRIVDCACWDFQAVTRIQSHLLIYDWQTKGNTSANYIDNLVVTMFVRRVYIVRLRWTTYKGLVPDLP